MTKDSSAIIVTAFGLGDQDLISDRRIFTSLLCFRQVLWPTQLTLPYGPGRAVKLTTHPCPLVPRI
jgi:hypothetical protein